MASNRSIIFDLGDGGDETIQLGSTIQKRGVIKVDGVNYPRATVAHLVPERDVNVPPNGFNDSIFDGTRIDAGSSYVGDNIGYDSAPPILSLPYTGVSSVYRVRAQMRLFFFSIPTGTVTLSVIMRDFNDNEITKSINGRDFNRFVNILEVDFIARIKEVTEVQIFNGTNLNLSIIGSRDPFASYLDVIYLGAD